MSRSGRSLSALALGAFVLISLAWFDRQVLWNAQREAAATFQMASYLPLHALGVLSVAAAILALGAAAWWSRSAVVGVIYAIVGAVFALLPILVLTGTTAFPDWMRQGLVGVLVSSSGPLNANATIGAGMLISGVLALYRAWSNRSRLAVS